MATSHFSEGGLGITNFSKEYIDVYLAAILYSKHSNILKVEYHDYQNNYGTHLYSLSFVSREAYEAVNHDLSSFWRVYDKLLAVSNAHAKAIARLDEKIAAEKRYEDAAKEYELALAGFLTR